MKNIILQKNLFFLFCLILLSSSLNCRADELVVIVSKDSQVQQLSKSDLIHIYRGEQTLWKDGTKITLVNREIEAPERALFYKILFKAPPDQKFYRPGTPIAVQSIIQRSNHAVKHFVSDVRGAIGYVPLSEVDGSVTVIMSIK